MLILVLRQLKHEANRTLLTLLAIAAALAVILLLEGFQTGLIQQLGRVALNRGADLIVSQASVNNFVAVVPCYRNSVVNALKLSMAFQ